MCFLCVFQCLWRCYAAEPHISKRFLATWTIHIHTSGHHHHHNAFSKAVRRPSRIRIRRQSKAGPGLANHITDRKDSILSVFMSDDQKSGEYVRHSVHKSVDCVGHSTHNRSQVSESHILYTSQWIMWDTPYTTEVR